MFKRLELERFTVFEQASFDWASGINVLVGANGTLARMRTEYVTPLLGKYTTYATQLEQQAETTDSTAEKNRLKKEFAALEKKRAELRAFDDQLKHYADRRIKLDLDDGVKVNYGKFGELLADVKAVTGGKE